MAVMMVLAVVIIGVTVALGYRRRRRRAAALGAWAAREGWTFTTTDPSVRAIPCGPAEHRATERHVLRGTARDGRPAVAFAASYVIRRAGSAASAGDDGGGSTGGPTTVQQAVVATTVAPSVPGGHPMVQVSPHQGARLLRRLRRDRRAVVTGLPDFDDRFDLLTDHPGAAAATVGPDVLAWLIADPRMRTTSFRLQGDTLAVWCGGVLTPELLGHLLDLATELRTRLGQDGHRVAA
jgi:hypothetical protein